MEAGFVRLFWFGPSFFARPEVKGTKKRTLHRITALGGVSIDGERRVRFGGQECAAIPAGVRLEEKDFAVTFDPAARSWTAAWARARYKEELDKWIQNGWLIPYDVSRHGPAKGLIPLMAIVQWTKGKSVLYWTSEN
ncbi:hypothetical protein D918_09380 [Trichuris suis]|nr:hypothetical protein D918_09380 [Trichuris suis]